MERHFLASVRIYSKRRPAQAKLLSVTAACNILREQGASAERIAAVQALAAAPALSAASLSKLPHMPARSAAEEEEDDNSHADEADEENEEDDYMAVEEDKDVDMVEEEDHPEVSPPERRLGFLPASGLLYCRDTRTWLACTGETESAQNLEAGETLLIVLSHSEAKAEHCSSLYPSITIERTWADFTIWCRLNTSTSC